MIRRGLGLGLDPKLSNFLTFRVFQVKLKKKKKKMVKRDISYSNSTRQKSKPHLQYGAQTMCISALITKVYDHFTR